MMPGRRATGVMVKKAPVPPGLVCFRVPLRKGGKNLSTNADIWVPDLLAT